MSSTNSEIVEHLGPLLERIALAIEALAPTEAPQASKISKESQAILLVVSERLTTVQQVADRLGVNRGTVYRWKSVMSAMDMINYAGTGTAPVRGSKARGDIEAW